VSGAVFLSLADRDKELGVKVAETFVELGFKIYATHGTAGHLARHGVATTHVDKVGEGRFDPVTLIEDGAIDLVVNTPRGRRARGDGAHIRRAATRRSVPCVTTIQGGLAVAASMRSGLDGVQRVASLQRLHGTPRG
jgi:carbamoyl-phosphate synthase large subunit